MNSLSVKQGFKYFTGYQDAKKIRKNMDISSKIECI